MTMNRTGRVVWVAAAVTLLAPALCLAIPDAAPVATQSADADGEMKARLAYNFGVETTDKAKLAEEEAASLKGAKQKQALEKARAQYAEARGNFETAAKANPQMPEAWNMIGFTSRHLGEYDKSLQAYDKAISMREKYVEAIEYRAEAYLGLNRIEDAKTAYMTLFSESRPVADTLMASMQRWVAERRRAPGALAAADLDAFAKWVDERSGVAKQTASLGLGLPAPAGWR